MGVLFAALVFIFGMVLLGAIAEAAENRRRLRIRGVRISDRRKPVARTGVSRYVVAMPSRTQRKRKGDR